MDIFERWESDIRGYCRAYPTVFATASGVHQVDEQGRTYIDFFAGAGVLNFGHNNPRMKQALIDYIQSDGVTHSLDMYTVAKRRFIERFVEVVLKPRDMDYRLQFMGPTGTNAVEASLKLARRVTGRRMVLAASNGFHGMTLGALACTANEYFRNAAGVPLDNVMRIPFENAAGGGVRMVRELQAAFAQSSSGLEPLAAVIVEPVQAEGGVNVASAEYLHALQDLAHAQGALFILDDIQAGCGRTGSYFSFDGMGLSPDIINLAKGIGGYGTPMAMNLNKPEHDKHWSPGEHTGTFRGQDFSFVAGAEALSYFEDDQLMSEVQRKGALMAERLQDLAQLHGRDFAVRGKGMMQALDVVDGALAKQVARHCFERGLLIGPCGCGGRVLKLIPPLVIDEADLSAGLDIFTAALAAAIEEHKHAPA